VEDHVAAVLLAIGSAVLGTKGLLTLGTDQFDTLEPWAGWLNLAFAGIAAAAGAGAFRGHRSAGPPPSLSPCASGAADRCGPRLWLSCPSSSGGLHSQPARWCSDGPR